MGNALEKELDYYIDHQDELVDKYHGKVIVIRDEQVIGAYDSDMEAIEKASEKYEIGTFLVQKCEPGPASYTQTFHPKIV